MLHGPADTVAFAEDLRISMTLPEVLLWREPRKRPGGLKFRRQHPAGKYVLDFFCAKLSLAVEVDGSVHDCGDVVKKIEERDAWLESQGVTVLRFPARDVLADVMSVVETILARVSEL